MLKGRVTWVTSEKAAPLLLGNPYIDHLYWIDGSYEALQGKRFDLVINLEDEPMPAALASGLRKGTLIGAYMGDYGVTYTESAREWFDMSLISKLGKQKADELKLNNRKAYQECVFSMVGHRFQGEKYVLNVPLAKVPVPNLVGLEPRAGGVWPMKRWNKYEALKVQLEAAGFKVKCFQQCDRLEEYVNDINECEYIVSGDTLAMHVALALGKGVVAIFTCTSPHEIWDYGRMIKVVSPVWQRYFYRRSFVPEAADAISVETVCNAFSILAGSKAALLSS